jgi:activator of HSP90 ATPase
MKKESVRVSAIIAAPAKQIYAAWLSSAGHSAMTDSAAKASTRVGGKFTAWDGYIEGRNIELVPHTLIVQAWRTSDFPNDAPDSRLEVTFADVKGGTRVALKHTDIPAGQGDGYKVGWIDYYLAPMKDYFSKKAQKKSPKKR